MYCPKCRKNVGNTEFCENCGAATIGNLAHEEAATTAVIPNDDLISIDSIKATFKKFSIKKLIAFALIAVIAIAAFIGYKAFEMYASPEQTANRYVTALVSGDYDTAFEMLEGTDDYFLSKDYFKKFMELKKIKGKNIVSVSKSTKDANDAIFNLFDTKQKRYFTTDEDALYFSAQVGLDFIEMVLVKRGNMYQLFDNWKIDTCNFIIEWDISVPKGSSVVVDGVTIEKLKETNKIDANSFFGTSAKETLTFNIEKMYPGEYELSATMEGGKDIKLTAMNDKAQELSFEPTDKLIEDLCQVSDNFLKLYYSNADINSFLGIVNPDIQFIKNLGNSWYDKRSSYKNLKLKSFNLSESSLQDADHVQITVLAQFQYDYEVWGWTETTTETRQEEQKYTMSFARDNTGKWIIDDINNSLF